MMEDDREQKEQDERRDDHVFLPLFQDAKFVTNVERTKTPVKVTVRRAYKCPNVTPKKNVTRRVHGCEIPRRTCLRFDRAAIQAR